MVPSQCILQKTMNILSLHSDVTSYQMYVVQRASGSDQRANPKVEEKVSTKSIALSFQGVRRKRRGRRKKRREETKSTKHVE